MDGEPSLILGFDPGPQTIEFFRSQPNELMIVLDLWYYEAVRAYYRVADDEQPNPARGFFTATRHLVLWCDSEATTINPAPFSEYSDQIWARVSRFHCPCGGTGINGKCNRCESVQGRNPRWAESDEMELTLGKVQAAKERLYLLAKTVYDNQRIHLTTAYPNYARDKFIYESRRDNRTWKEIAKLLEEHNDWEPLLESGIRKAAGTYAKRCKLPILKPGNAGRPPRK